MPILQRVTCPDDPKLMLEQQMCVSPMSKTAKGRITDPEPERRECADPPCLSLTTRQQLELRLEPFECDERELSRLLLNGVIRVTDLVHVFDGSGDGRGFHSGDFRWEAGRILIFGRMSGITNAGTHHDPVMKCQECKDPGFLQGRLCGSIARAEDPALRGAQIFGNYALRVERVDGDGIPGQGVLGTFEGVLVRGCGCC
ncbi:MAG: hypothetical protein ABW156_12130 [Jiangellaceae bacterium]